jgi:hypothetical protein
MCIIEIFFIINNCVKQKQEKIISNPVEYRHIHISLCMSIMRTLQKKNAQMDRMTGQRTAFRTLGIKISQEIILKV